MPLSIREWDCPSFFCIDDRDVNAAKNICAMGLADTLGLSDCVKETGQRCNERRRCIICVGHKKPPLE